MIMILIMSVKQWKKNAEKLAKPKNFTILDATDKDAADSEIYIKYQRCVKVEGLRMPKGASKLIKELNIFDDDISKSDFGDAITDINTLYKEDVDKAFKKGWERQCAPMDAFHTIFSAQAENPEVNLFVVFKNKDYKVFSNFIKSCFERVLGYDPDDDKSSGIVFTYEEYSNKNDDSIKKIVNKKPLKDSQMAVLSKTVKKLEEKFDGFDYDKFRTKQEQEKAKKKQDKLKKRQKEREKARKEKADLTSSDRD